MQLRPALAATIAALASVCFALSAHSAAYAKCQPSSNDPSRVDDGYTYLDGWDSYQGQTVGGSYAGILNYSPWVQPGQPGTVAWTMIHREESGECDYAQVGWFEGAYGDRHTFTEYTTGCTPHLDRTYDPYPIGENITYQVLYDNTPGAFTFWADGVAIGEVDTTFTPDDAQQFGEIKTLASQMPGGYDSDAHEDISGAHVYYGGDWHDFDGQTSNMYNQWFGLYQSSGTDINIWDKDCPS